MSNPGDLWPLRHLIKVMRGRDLTNKKTMTKTNKNTTTKTEKNTFWDYIQRAILIPCDIWDTDYISDNWEPEFMTIFVTWKSSVARDSICNSYDVLYPKVSTYAKSASFQVPNNGTLSSRSQKCRPLFSRQLPPKCWHDICFVGFSLLGWILSQFWHFAHFGHFWELFRIDQTKCPVTLEEGLK